ncbi:MAG TPA: DUF2934 domain-containing protein [Bryobacteraceae bacterium]|nr:DUF2934 domain-containing protein [Bryobacteraceae bacterium]
MDNEVILAESEFLSGNAPSQEDIAALAYALWQERGCPEGTPEEDWFRAEQNLKLMHHAAGA